jgi:predicted MFS family arabinose efflux permease
MAWAASLFLGVVLMGLVTGVSSWRWGYAAAVAGIVVLASLLRLRLPADTRHRDATVRTTTHGPALGIGWWVVAASFTLTASAQAVFVTFGKWLEQDFGFSETRITGVIFAIGAVELVASAATVRFADAWGKQRSTMIGAAVMVPAAVLLAASAELLWPGVVLIALFIGAFEFAIVSNLSLSSNLVPGHAAKGLGLTVGAGTLGRAAMATPATAAFTAHGLWLPAALAAASAAITVMCHRAHRRRRVLEPQPA